MVEHEDVATQGWIWAGKGWTKWFTWLAAYRWWIASPIEMLIVGPTETLSILVEKVCAAGHANIWKKLGHFQI